MPMIKHTEFQPMHVSEFMEFVSENLNDSLGERGMQMHADDVNAELNEFYRKKPSNYSYLVQVKRDRNKTLFFGEDHSVPAQCDVVVVWLVGLPDGTTKESLDKVLDNPDEKGGMIEHTFFMRLNDHDLIYAVDKSFTPQ